MNVIRISKQAWLITVTNHSPINHSKLAQSFSKLINLKLIISWVSATDINSQRLCVDGLLMYFDHSWIFHMERHHQRKCRAMSWKSRDTQKKIHFSHLEAIGDVVGGQLDGCRAEPDDQADLSIGRWTQRSGCACSFFTTPAHAMQTLLRYV